MLERGVRARLSEYRLRYRGGMEYPRLSPLD